MARQAEALQVKSPNVQLSPPGAPNPHKRYTGLMRVWRALVNSLSGLRVAWQEESAFRQETVIAVVMLPVAFWLGQGPWQVLALVASMALVLIAELLNSAIEAEVDRVSLEIHPLAKKAKDCGSAAVFLAMLLCGAAWCIALWQRIAG